MNHRSRRRGALTTVVGLFMAGLAVGVTSSAVDAAPGTLATTNACQNNATSTYADLSWTLSGTATPSPATLGTDTITLGLARVQVQIPGAILVAGYNTGVLVPGVNPIPTVIYVARQATNVDTGTGTKGTLVKVDSVSINLSTTITDPDGIPGGAGPGGADETATPMSVDLPLPDWTVTPLGGDVSFSQAPAGSLGRLPIGPGGALTPVNGSLFTQSNVGLKVNFDCSPGTTIPVPPSTTSGTSFTPAASIGAFEVAPVIAPPTAPECTAEAVSVGVGQSQTIDLTNNCTDVNESQGGGGPFIYTVGTPSAGTLVATATAGVYSYTAPATDPGPVVFTFTATDKGVPALTSAPANITVTVLANQCNATDVKCDLTQIVVQPVVGTTMTMDKVPGFVIMSPVVLNGKEQVSTGALNTVTVTNARGTAAGWSVTAYATDIGAAGARTFTPLPGVTVPLCSTAGAGPLVGTPAEPPGISSDRLCIPGDNLGWTPAAAVGHNDIPGDVAQVTPGAASAADPAAWLAALVAAGNTSDPGVGVDGLGGLLGGATGPKTLCSAPVNHAGGTFTCNAALYLGVPASAGAGQYTGGIVLTLV